MTYENPLLEDLPFPAFDRITPAHFMPAFELRREEARAAFARIKGNTAPATLANTLVPLEKLFAPLHDLYNLVSALSNVAAGDAMSVAEGDVFKAFTAFGNEIYQDEELAARYAALKNALGPTPDLDDQDRHFLARTDSFFEAAGATLDAAGKTQIREVDDRLGELATQFNGHLRKAVKDDAVWVADAAELAGIDAAMVESFAQAARENGHDGQWMIAADRLLIDNLLETAESRSLRKKLYDTMQTMCASGPNDNRAIVGEMMALRAQRARLLGYADYAAYKMKGSMAQSPENVLARMNEVIPPLLRKFESEMAVVGEYARTQDGPDVLEPWDVPFWAARYTAEKYGYSQAELSQYFELDAVLDGFLDHASALFSVEFRRNDELYPRWHDNARVYDVCAADSGEHLAVMVIDPYLRPESKAGGAWMDSVQLRGDGRLPVIGVNVNQIRAEGQKTLLPLEDVITVFHEGGHGLQGVFGSVGRYASLHGPEGGPSDYTEIFSTMQEMFALTPQCLARYARHYQTGAPLPQDLYDRMKASATFFQAASMLRLLQNARRDVLGHSGDPSRFADLTALERESALDTPFSDHVRPYPYARFMHMFFEGESKYAAGYYGYFWSQMHAAAAFQPFAGGNTYHPAWAKRLRDFYAQGSGIDFNAAFEAYLGHKATPERYLAEAGIETPKTAANTTLKNVIG